MAYINLKGYEILWQMPTGQRLESAPLEDFLYSAILSTNLWAVYAVYKLRGRTQTLHYGKYEV